MPSAWQPFLGRGGYAVLEVRHHLVDVVIGRLDQSYRSDTCQYPRTRVTVFHAGTGMRGASDKNPTMVL